MIEDRVVGDVGLGKDRQVVFHVPVEELLADAGKFSEDAVGVGVVFSLADCQGEFGAGGVGEGFEGAIGCDDAVVVGGGQEGPMVDFRQQCG